MKHAKKQKRKRHDSNSNSDYSTSSWSDGYGSTENACKKHNCSKKKFGTYPSPIKTTKRINSRFFLKILVYMTQQKT